LPHCFTKGTIFGLKKKGFEHETVSRFSRKLLSKTFLILRRIGRDMTINLHRLHVACPLFSSDLNGKSLSTDITKNKHVSNFMKIRPEEAMLFHADG